MKGHLGICFQQSFGTAYISSFFYVPLISESVVESIPPIVSEGMRGRFEEGDSYEGAHEVAGDVVIPAHPVLLGVLLKAWCGQSSGSLATSVYTHTFQPKTSDFGTMAAVPPMTIEVYRDSGSAHQYHDCLCNGLSIEIAYGAIIKATMSIMGASFAKVAKTGPTYIAGSEFVWNQSSISFGGAVDEVSQITLNMANNLEGRGTLDGTKKFNRIKRAGFRTIDVSGTILFVDDAEFDKWHGQTTQKTVITVTGQAITSGYNGTFEADIPTMRYSEFPVNIGGPGMIEVGFAASAKYNTGSATMAKFTLVNTQSVY